MAFETLMLRLRAFWGNRKGIGVGVLVLAWAVSRFIVGGLIGELIALGFLFGALMLLVSHLQDRRKKKEQ